MFFTGNPRAELGEPASLARTRQLGLGFDEWSDILKNGSDGELFASMLGRDDRSNRLRQSMPYVGLLSPEEVEKLREEAAG